MSWESVPLALTLRVLLPCGVCVCVCVYSVIPRCLLFSVSLSLLHLPLINNNYYDTG